MDINVSNRKCIRRISFQHMKTAKTRNAIAILAVSLTAVLFTALFTIISSVIFITEQNTFRQIGTCSHGAFKYLSKEQVNELREDPLIREYALRRIVGVPTKEPFLKTHVEVSWCDANYAKWGFTEPEKGRLPQEGTREAAADTEVLSLLGVEPEIGAEFTITFEVDGKETTETFILSGYWEYDDVSPSSHVFIPASRADEIFTTLDTQGNDGTTGTYSLDVIFENASGIKENLLAVLERHGYQNENMTDKDSYISIGVNWGYAGAQLSDGMDAELIASIAALLLIIIFTGYLIIYNVFQISVSNDIRFYGLLKTIGTTGRQIRRLITLQAFYLSAAGIPLGLLFGYFLGIFLTPVVLSNLHVRYESLSVSPWIFAASALFSLFTVVISCRKPGKIAAKVSPIEAIRYTEGINVQSGKRQNMKQPNIKPKNMKLQNTKSKNMQLQGRNTRQGAGPDAFIFRMAWGNLERNRKKTTVTVLSLSLAIVLLNITAILTNSFDMDKYVSTKIVTDFILGDVSYFDDWYHWNGATLPESTISLLYGQGKIADGGRTYGHTGNEYVIHAFVPESHYRDMYGMYYEPEEFDIMLESIRNGEGLVEDGIMLYGMEPFCLDKLIVHDGDLSKLYGDGNYIAALYLDDNYGNITESTNWAKPGDKITLRYKELEFYNTVTGEIYSSPYMIPESDIELSATRARAYHDVEYEVAAVVTRPESLSYRISTFNEFALNAEVFKRDSGTDSVMYYAFDMEEGGEEAMENYLSDFTKKSNPQYNYESKFTYIEDYRSFVNTFLLLGSVLSFIIGLIGVLNFLNSFLTSILSRRREFAVLQSVGMTGRQLKKMLITEGELLTAGSILLAFILSVMAGPFVSGVVNGMFWFFTYRFTILPLAAVTPFFIALGYLLPLITYRLTSGKSIVERLREASEG